MLSFACDYTEGAHPEILRRICQTNLQQQPGYGSDEYCAAAKEKIKAACGCPNGQVFFLVGGTQTNQLVIRAMLQSYEGVISAQTGHINAHEAGAVEFTGHKVLSLPQHEGKLSSKDLRDYLKTFFADENREHMVFPGMVYISHPTEYGTLYTLQELTALSEVCRQYQLPLFMDGARLGYGLMSSGTDVTLQDIARLCDVFYIGGTKVGALCGEAVVFPQGNAPRHFFTSIKQSGALLAKGRLLGIQFETLFTDDLYFKISRHAIEMADQLRRGFREKGYKFYLETVTNQIFVILDNDALKRLEGTYSFWERLEDSGTVVRFATSWATREEDVVAFLEKL